jgi:hypothetical protein
MSIGGSQRFCPATSTEKGQMQFRIQGSTSELWEVSR